MKFLRYVCLTGLLFLGGCAINGVTDASSVQASATGTTPPTSPTPAPAEPEAQIAPSHIPEYPAGELTPITSGEMPAHTIAEMTPPADMWERIRRGFAMTDLQSDLVPGREQWYATRTDELERMTERSRKYLFYIVEELERRNLPTELALLPFIESAFNPQAYSRARAAGMWQFIPSTGKRYDLKQNAFRDDRRDVLASTSAALDYLEKLYGMFGDWHLALAAYNWGEGSVGRAIARNQRQGKGTGYLDLRQRMPMETRFYVPKLQAIKNIVANPQAFGVTLPMIENHPYFDSVTITRDIDVTLAAQLAEVPLEDFKELNPSLHRPVILAAGTPQILLPWDNAAIFQRNLDAYAGSSLASWTVWVAPRTMKSAEAARLVHMRESDLRAINRIPANMLIRAGSTLLAPRPASQMRDVGEHIADNGQLRLSPEKPVRRTLLKVGKRGDTVANIARRYRLPVGSVASWNNVSTSARFKYGDTVVVYMPSRVYTQQWRAPRSSSRARISKRPVSPTPQLAKR